MQDYSQVRSHHWFWEFEFKYAEMPKHLLYTARSAALRASCVFYLEDLLEVDEAITMRVRKSCHELWEKQRN